MRYVFILVGIYLIYSGLVGLSNVFRNKKTQFLEFSSTTYIERKVFGKHFNKWHNFFWGAICLISGILILLNYISISPTK